MIYDPEKLRDLIPEYVNGTLSEKERKKFDLSLDTFPDVRQEVLEFTEIKSAYNAMGEELPAPSDAVYQKVMRRLEVDRKAMKRKEKGFLGQMKDVLGPLFASPHISWAVAGVQMAVILLLVVSAPTEKQYATLTSQQSAEINGTTINIVFDPQTKEMELRSILNRSKAVIIRGPSSEGLYTIRINEDRNVDQAVEDLKENSAVKFAEKVYGIGSE